MRGESALRLFAAKRKRKDMPPRLAADRPARPRRRAASECKRRIAQQLGVRKKRSAAPHHNVVVLNEHDAFTLEKVEPQARTAFWAAADPEGRTAYVHDGPALLRFCCDSPGEPRDPVTMRRLDDEEIGRLERVAGCAAGEVARRRAAARADREQRPAAASDEHQRALLQALCETITEAFDEALVCAPNQLMEFVAHTVASYGALVRSMLPHLISGDADHLRSAVADEITRGMMRAHEVCDERPHAIACASIVADVTVECVAAMRVG